MIKKFKNEFWNDNIKIFNHIYVGTNDYEKDLLYLQNKVSDIIDKNILIYDNILITVSGGWFYILSIIPNNIYFKYIYIYDINPNMLFIYNLIYLLFIISNTYDNFITNLFCRIVDHKLLKTNNNKYIEEFMNIQYDKNIYNNIKKKLKKYGTNGKYAYIIYKLFIKKHVINNNNKYINTIPTYYYDDNNPKIFNKKLHTTQSINNTYHYLTTFYYNILEPFISNISYNNLRNHLLYSNINFLTFDLNKININSFNFNNISIKTNILLYIDGIDLEFSNYLIIKRNDLFNEINNIVKNNNYIENFFVLSTKSGLTQINKNNIIYDNIYNKNPLKFNNKKIYDSIILNDKINDSYIIKLNNNNKYYIIKTFKSSEKYNLFKKIPKPFNSHIHFSMIVPYKKILNIINNENINIYIKIKNNIITLGYENEELNNKNSVLYDKNIHHNIVIKYINNITNNINFNNINLLG